MKKAVLYVLVFFVSFALGAVSGVTVSKITFDDEAQAQTNSPLEVPEKKSVLTAPVNTLEPEKYTETENTGENKYLLSLSDNGISVYKVLQSGQTEFLYKKDVDASVLRQDDYTKLCSGIMVYSEQEAIEILEDFIS